MNQPMTVGQLNDYVSTLLEQDSLLNPVMVKGELSGVKAYPSGHVYFTLKDRDASVSCVLFKGYATRLRFRPENGMNVIVTGRATLYARDGRYQLIITDMTPDGLGALYLAFEQLKEKLKKEGLFDPKHKRKIPLLPNSIGIVTSPAGAVIRDIIQVSTRRFPNANLKLFPVPVQGETAAAEIAHAIRKLNEWSCVDVIIVGRGGGSLEDLWPFNEEIVARAVYDSVIPIISAVGHETDFTICDFVADLRAPTPSAAAELALPVRREEDVKIANLRNQLVKSLGYRLEREKNRLMRLKESRGLREPVELIDRRRQDLDRMVGSLQQAMKHLVLSAERQLSIRAGQLHALSPLRVLSRGYGLIQSAETEKPLRSVAMIRPGDKIEVTMIDGRLHCDVQQVTDRRFEINHD
jgi:exodeoxyribonuclease VII large subunit